jgi:biopolymer transport protein ExbD
VPFRGPEAFAEELKRASGGNADPVIVINADQNATHQSVINVMEAARVAGFARITFTTQSAKK